MFVVCLLFYLGFPLPFYGFWHAHTMLPVLFFSTKFTHYSASDKLLRPLYTTQWRHSTEHTFCLLSLLSLLACRLVARSSKL